MTSPGEQRLHPLSFLFIAGANVGGLIFPALLVLFVARGATWQLWALWISIPYLLVALLRYVTFRYEFAPNDLVIRTGLLFRNERHIRYARIQNVEMLRNPLHRMLGVVEVRVQTAGGQEPEARVQVLSVGAAEEMRYRVLEAKRAARRTTETSASELPAASDAACAESSAAPDIPLVAAGAETPGAPVVPLAAAAAEIDLETPSRTLLRLRLRELVLFGLVDNRGMLVAAAVFGLIWEANVFQVEGISDRGLWEWFQAAFGVVRLDQGISAANIVAAASVLLLSVLAVRVLSIGWAIVKLYGFTLELSSEELKTTCGLFTQVRSSVPRHRIQLLSMVETPLQRLFGRARVHIETAGGDLQASEARHWLAPIIEKSRVPALLAEVDAAIDMDALTWHGVHPLAWWRLLRRSLWIALFATALCVWVWGLPGLLAIPPFAGLAWMYARGRAARIGYALTPDLVFVRDGWLWRHVSVARCAKVQNATLGESPFDRNARMASVSADTAGGGAHRIRVRYLEVGDAGELHRRLAEGAAGTAFRW